MTDIINPDTVPTELRREWLTRPAAKLAAHAGVTGLVPRASEISPLADPGPPQPAWVEVVASTWVVAS